MELARTLVCVQYAVRTKAEAQNELAHKILILYIIIIVHFIVDFQLIFHLKGCQGKIARRNIPAADKPLLHVAGGSPAQGPGF